MKKVSLKLWKCCQPSGLLTLNWSRARRSLVTRLPGPAYRAPSLVRSGPPSPTDVAPHSTQSSSDRHSRINPRPGRARPPATIYTARVVRATCYELRVDSARAGVWPWTSTAGTALVTHVTVRSPTRPPRWHPHDAGSAPSTWPSSCCRTTEQDVALRPRHPPLRSSTSTWAPRSRPCLPAAPSLACRPPVLLTATARPRTVRRPLLWGTRRPPTRSCWVPECPHLQPQHYWGLCCPPH